ncbi:chaperonin CPN60-2, mitochondrial [Tanacetum coccineum]|uniref:Chaperonin CPN60-2, mitochondrial n=1 Tax=Tanacetum coccineum TaxID=301880 RepID=A0ABQ5J7G3_9ASTR
MVVVHTNVEFVFDIVGKLREDDTVVLDVAGEKKGTEERCEQLRSLIELSTSAYDKEKLLERLAKHSGRLAVLKIVIASEVEVGEKKDRVTNTLNATKIIFITLWSSIDVQTQEQTSKHVEENVNVVLKHSKSINQQSLKISNSRLKLCNRQLNMIQRLDEGMSMLNDSANKLGE